MGTELSSEDQRKIRNQLLSIFRENGKITERDLLRLSAMTGINYSQIVEIQKKTNFRSGGFRRGFFRRPTRAK